MFLRPDCRSQEFKLDEEHDLDLAAAACDRQRNLVLMAVEYEIKTGRTDREIS